MKTFQRWVCFVFAMHSQSASDFVERNHSELLGYIYNYKCLHATYEHPHDLIYISKPCYIRITAQFFEFMRILKRHWEICSHPFGSLRKLLKLAISGDLILHCLMVPLSLGTLVAPEGFKWNRTLNETKHFGLEQGSFYTRMTIRLCTWNTLKNSLQLVSHQGPGCDDSAFWCPTYKEMQQLLISDKLNKTSTAMQGCL